MTDVIRDLLQSVSIICMAVAVIYLSRSLRQLRRAVLDTGGEAAVARRVAEEALAQIQELRKQPPREGVHR